MSQTKNSQGIVAHKGQSAASSRSLAGRYSQGADFCKSLLALAMLIWGKWSLHSEWFGQ